MALLPQTPDGWVAADTALKMIGLKGEAISPVPLLKCLKIPLKPLKSHMVNHRNIWRQEDFEGRCCHGMGMTCVIKMLAGCTSSRWAHWDEWDQSQVTIKCQLLSVPACAAARTLEHGPVTHPFYHRLGSVFLNRPLKYYLGNTKCLKRIVQRENP